MTTKMANPHYLPEVCIKVRGPLRAAEQQVVGVESCRAASGANPSLAGVPQTRNGSVCVRHLLLAVWCTA